MSTENLNRDEALDKMKSMVKDIKTCMLVTDFGNKPLSAVPMTTKEVDKEGNIWFFSRLDSDHNGDIAKDNDVQLLFSDTSDMEFISIYGKASIETNEGVLKEFYGKMDDAWFDGVDDPNLTAIKVVPKEAYFWDNKQNKFVTFLKIGAAAVSGDKKGDIGEKGKLNL
ncbi:pyridoxamine 5'-phosphate oxidase family protein [Salegentibacter salegens]|uniref:General stress protein 26 n=1 Tax=Salegentibacter salegens TaxID=143223 RepID=A0A1M7I8D0_9FLAO|nr:pyridoxamine 5'-phosphate oxidase family protein [Salegentibacter salegens]PRX47989.1 general stress protein 26 [Salegentibacter salegens]SHM36994.1 General stress protein 26 [Salegentibacter salegens]